MSNFVENKSSPDFPLENNDISTKRRLPDSETDVLSDNSAGKIRRHRCTKTNGDFDDSTCISEECKVNKHICAKEEGGDSSEFPTLSRLDTDSPIFLDGVKTNTSEWTLECLHNFRIQIDTLVSLDKLLSAYDVFTKGYIHFITERNKYSFSDVMSKIGFRSADDKQLVECCEHAVHDVFNIDCNHIYEVSEADLKKIDTDSWIDYFAETFSNTKHWNARKRLYRDLSRLSQLLEMFKDQLLYMVRKRRRDDFKEISEGMYQELFVSFARIFGLKIVNGSNVEKYTLKINNTDIVAVPDGLICHTTDTDEDKICAIIEVKRYKEDEDMDVGRTVRNTKKAYYAQHIGSSLTGRLMGQFLCTLSSSAFRNNGIYGFLVQGTNVTLTTFKPEDGYYENLCKGFLQKKEAVITYSKEYNILKREDRRELVQTFLDMKKLLHYV